MKSLLFVCLLVACAKKQEAPKEQTVPAMSAAEIQRSSDACKAYVDKVCACAATVPAVQDECNLSKALPEAVRIGVEVSQSAESKPKDIYGAQDSVRKAVKTCIEKMAQLPSRGCP
ncbi:MAG: hypothetical protein JO257_20915 [Deltaproteobacteria bacterium]|nr:hypothetical protein [Deltaproteobacteria bacterium]